MLRRFMALVCDSCFRVRDGLLSLMAAEVAWREISIPKRHPCGRCAAGLVGTRLRTSKAEIVCSPFFKLSKSSNPKIYRSAKAGFCIVTKPNSMRAHRKIIASPLSHPLAHYRHNPRNGSNTPYSSPATLQHSPRNPTFPHPTETMLRHHNQ